MSQSTLEAYFPPPKDLTSHLDRKADAQYCAAGAFGDVYRCWCRDGLPKEVAVKAFRFLFTINDASSNRSMKAKILRRELGIWRRLNHKNVVPFLGITYGFGFPNSISLVSLWMPNGSLSVFLDKYDDILEPGHRLQLLLDIANGLDYLHSIPIVHGDLSGNNVLIDKDYNARLVDFGHASLTEEIPARLIYLKTSSTRTGALPWTAPEQLNSTGTPTTKSDIYSLGCLGLQVLSGKLPWSEARRDITIILRLSRGENPGRPASRPIEDPHWNFIEHCWSSINERPVAGETVAIIEQFLDHSPLPQPPHDLLALRLSEASDPVVGPALSSSQTTTNVPKIIGGFDTFSEDNWKRPAIHVANTKPVKTLSPQDAYAKNFHQPGLFLRTPEPSPGLPSSYQQYGLHIGDVGYVDDYGKFEVLFNICSPVDHELHKCHPPNICDLVGLVEFDPHEATCIPDAMPAGCVICTGIETPLNDNTKHTQRFVSTSGAGSILILPHGATQYSLNEFQAERFRTAAQEHALEWCRFARRKSLGLITGFYKTRTWHLASFRDVTPIGQVLLESDGTGKYTWDSRCDYRCAGRENYLENQTVVISGLKVEMRGWASRVSSWNLLSTLGAAGTALFKATTEVIAAPARHGNIHVNHVPA